MKFVGDRGKEGGEMDKKEREKIERDISNIFEANKYPYRSLRVFRDLWKIEC